MYNYFVKDIRNLKTEGIKSIQLIKDRAKNAILAIKYDRYGYPTFWEYTGMHGHKEHYEVCMCKNYYKNNKISRRIVARSLEGIFSHYSYVYDNDLLIRTYEFEIDNKLIPSSTTNYKYYNGRLTSIDTTYNSTRNPEHISFEYKDDKTILIYEDGYEIIGKTDDGKIAYYSVNKPLESRYDFIYENNNCIGIKTGIGFLFELVIQR